MRYQDFIVPLNMQLILYLPIMTEHLLKLRELEFNKKKLTLNFTYQKKLLKNLLNLLLTFH